MRSNLPTRAIISSKWKGPQWPWVQRICPGYDSPAEPVDLCTEWQWHCMRQVQKKIHYHGNPKSWIFFSKKVRNWIWSEPREKKSPLLRRYQYCISNWYINGKFFTSTTTWKPKNLILLKKNEIEFCLLF